MARRNLKGVTWEVVVEEEVAVVVEEEVAVEGLMVVVRNIEVQAEVEEQRPGKDSSQTVCYFLYQYCKMNSFQHHEREPHLPFQAHHQHLPRYACVYQL
jgi:hypothetical protein